MSLVGATVTPSIGKAKTKLRSRPVKLEIFGPLILLGISVVESYWLRSRTIKSVPGSNWQVGRSARRVCAILRQ
jgi:hypothetical protein